MDLFPSEVFAQVTYLFSTLFRRKQTFKCRVKVMVNRSIGTVNWSRRSQK